MLNSLWLAVLDDAAFGAATEVVPKFICRAGEPLYQVSRVGPNADWSFRNCLMGIEHSFLPCRRQRTWWLSHERPSYGHFRHKQFLRLSGQLATVDSVPIRTAEPYLSIGRMHM